MERKKRVPEGVIARILERYGLGSTFREPKEYINFHGEDRIKVIFSVLLEDGRRVIIKILHEHDDLGKERAKVETQSAFSEWMRQSGIKTPRRYRADGVYCSEIIYQNLPCHVTVEDWCGEEIMVLTTGIAYKIGVLMARMHSLSLEHKWEIGCGTLFSAAYWNDVDEFQKFCEIGQNQNLDQTMVEQIKKFRGEKLEALRTVWDTLPRAAVQGDISINNLVDDGEEELTVFDYNNAGDEVLISDLVMEGLLTAYEMDLPAGADQSEREKFFPALLRGYLSVRTLSEEEADAAWIIYTLYHGLWFTRIVYRDDSLEKLVEKEDYAAANRLLAQMLADLTEHDDGRFRNGTK